MSDVNLPVEIQLEIMKSLPVKSLLQFRSVSKTWKSLIDSSDFVVHYHPQQQHLLVTDERPHDAHPNYVSIADDDTFPHHKFSPTVPLLVSILEHSFIIGSAQGLFCVYGVYSKSRGDSISETNVAVLWNLSIRRAIPVVVPNVIHGMYNTVIAFGVCRETMDPKIVKITCIESESNIESISCIPRQIEVFTLSTGVWRRPHSSNLPRKSIKFYCFQLGVAVDGVLYWLASDRIRTDGGYYSYCYLIVSFDITTEEFREVNLPHSLTCESHCDLSMSKLRDSVVVIQHDAVEAYNHVIDVWRMEDGVEKSFIKLFSVNLNTPHARVRGFRRSGDPVIEIEISGDDLPIYELAVYDPYSKLMDYLEMNGIACTFYVHPYMETLLLLDQPNVAAYTEMETIRFLDDLVS